MRNIITIATYSNLIEAHLKKARLEAEGINCYLTDEHIISLIPIYSFAIGNIKLKVFEEDARKARKIVSPPRPVFVDNFELKTENEDKSGQKCPNCLSQNFYKQGFSKKSLLGFLFLGFPVPIISKTYHCFDCGYRWKN